MKNFAIFSKKDDPNPERDWKAIFAASLVAVLILLAADVYVYAKIGKGEIFVGAEGEGGVQGLDLEKVRGAAEYYRNKANNFQNILKSSSSTPISDPSI